MNKEELVKNVFKIFDDTHKKIGEKEDIYIVMGMSSNFDREIRSECTTIEDVRFHSSTKMFGCQFTTYITV